MAETTADVRRDIELTRERMSSTLAALEERLNVMEFVKENPWPAIAIAAGAGFALSGSGADVKAAAATTTAAHAASVRTSRLGPGLDEVVARLLGGVQAVLLQRADELVDELRGAIGVKGGDAMARPAGTSNGGAPAASSPGAAQGGSHGGAQGAGYGASSGDAYGTQRQLGDVTGGASGRPDPYGANPTRAD